MPCDYQSSDNYFDINRVLSDLSFSFAKYNIMMRYELRYGRSKTRILMV